MKIHIIAALLASVLLHNFAAAAGVVSATPGTPPPLDITLTVKKIVVVDGKERRLDAVHAEPGDVLEYRTEYKNSGTAALRELSVTLPLPEHTTFVIGSAYPGGSEVSSRSAKDVFAPLASKEILEKIPPRNTEYKSGGETVPISGNAYGALRWTVDELKPGQMTAVGARVRVDAVVSKKTPDAPPTIQAAPSISQ